MSNNKEIIDVNAKGITYIDEKGDYQSISFNNCHQNFLSNEEKSWGSEYTEERRQFYQRSKYVGVRYALSDPPALEFYTRPRTVFEFSSREDLSDILVQIKNSGWRTRDGE